MYKQSILIADNQTITNEGLKSVIGNEPCYEIVSIVSEKEELFEFLKKAPQGSLFHGVQAELLFYFDLFYFQRYFSHLHP